MAVGSAMPWPAMSGAEPCTGSNMLGLVPEASRLPLAASPMPPVTAAAMSVTMSPKRLSVTMDVVAAGVGDEEHRGRVDVLVGDRDLRELGRHLLDRARPQPAGVGEHVGLVDQGEVLARSGHRPLERVPDHPLDTEGGVQRRPRWRPRAACPGAALPPLPT